MAAVGMPDGVQKILHYRRPRRAGIETRDLMRPGHPELLNALQASHHDFLDSLGRYSVVVFLS